MGTEEEKLVKKRAYDRAYAAANRDRISDFGQGWHTNPSAIEALRAAFAELDARGL